MIDYQDLLFASYTSEFDCYRIVIECTKRHGKELKNFHDIKKADVKDLQNFVKRANVREIQGPKDGAIMQTEFNNEIHLGFMLDKKNVLHIIKTGARVSPVEVFKNKKFYEVV